MAGTTAPPGGSGWTHDEFAAIFERHYHSVFTFLHERLPSREAAEDATAKTFMLAMRAPRPPEPEDVRAWLLKIATDVATDHRRRTQEPPPPLYEADPLERLARAATGRREGELDEERAARLRAAIARLPEAQREVLELRLLGLDSKEIALVVAKSESVVRQLHARALQGLRRDLDDPPAAAPVPVR